MPQHGVADSARMGEFASPCPHPACRACAKLDGFGVPAKVWMNQPDRPDGDYQWGINDHLELFTGSVGSMLVSDFVALGLCATVISFSLSAELRDVKLCEITIRARGDKFPMWRGFLLFVCTVRQYVVIPCIGISVPALVLYDGGAAKNIALNTVGCLFLLAIDNEAFDFALPQQLRMHAEENGRADVSAQQLEAIEVAKFWCWVLVIVAVMVPIFMSHYWLFDCEDCKDNKFIFVQAVATCAPILNIFPGFAEAWITAGFEEAEEAFVREQRSQPEETTVEKAFRRCSALMWVVGRWLLGGLIILALGAFIYS